MNPQLNYYSAASAHAAALRDSYRNPPLPRVDIVAEPAPERRSRLAQALGRVAQAGHRREYLVAVR